MIQKLFSRIRQRYGDLKLHSKFTVALLPIVIIPAFLVVFFFFGKLSDMVVSYTIRQEQDASAKTAPKIEETIQQVLDAYSRITSLDFYRTMFYQPVDAQLTNITQSQEAADFSRQIKQITKDTPVTSVQIYVDFPENAGCLFQNPNTKDIFAPVSQIQGTYWHGIFQSSSVSDLHCPSFYLGTKEQEQNGNMAYIHSTTWYCNSVPYQAYIAVYYSTDHFTDILSKNLTLEGSVSYIMNERNTLVASSDESLSGIYWLNYDSIEESFMSSNNFIQRDILGKTIYAGFYNIKQTGWFMVTILPSEPLMKQSYQMIFRFLVVYVIFAALSFFLANLLSSSITKRISSVISKMRSVRQGPPVAMDSPADHDEIGDLINTYNYMVDQLNQLMEQQAKASEDLRIAEFNSLQAQINPHFLYNTMDMINWLALQGRTSEISNAVQNLSRFYKLTLSRKKSITTIAKEEEHVSIYVRLQNMRFHDQIQLISDIPDELMEYQIPRLTLQPVIENAILHGILEKESKEGTIVLTGWMEEEDIILLISDDGVGIPPEKLDVILSGTGKSVSGGSNIAIYNTHRRLQILYGERYGLIYSSPPGEGTEVQIRIPAHKDNEY